jgi:NitT/TauT family transport system substrate-binding protein
VLPQDNSLTLTAFKQRRIGGAWLPEPWASRLTVEGGGNVLVDERDLWPQGRFATTNLVVSAKFIHDHPKRVTALVEGLYRSITYLNSNPVEAQQVANDALTEITGKRLAAGVVSQAWLHMTFTLDPLASTLKTSADRARSLGLLSSADLGGLYYLVPVNRVLLEHQEGAVKGL